MGFATVSGTARAPSDYAPRSGQVTFSPGERTKTVSVSIRGDRTREPDESVSLELSRPVNAAIGRERGFETIRDDD